MIEFLAGPIMPRERRYFIQMNTVICVVKGRRTICSVCQLPAITFNRTEGGGRLNVSDDVSAYTDSSKGTHTVTLEHLYINTVCYILIIHQDN